jgi:hypothetical protein
MRRRNASALVVPESALSQLQGTYQAAVVGPDNKVSLRRIEVGPATGGLRVVTAGCARASDRARRRAEGERRRAGQPAAAEAAAAGTH